MNNTKFAIAILVVSLLGGVSCVKDSIWLPTKETPSKALDVTEAKKYVKDHLGEIHLVNLHSTVAKTKSISEERLYDPQAQPDWSRAKSYEEESQVSTVEIPLKTQGSIYALCRKREQGKISHRRTPIHSVLVVRRQGDITIPVVATLYPDRKYRDQKGNDVTALEVGRLHQSNYSGMLTVSNTEGRLMHGMVFREGKVVGRFAPKRQIQPDEPHSDCGHSGCQTRSVIPDSTVQDSIKPLFSIQMHLVDREAVTRSYMDSWEFDDVLCALCMGSHGFDSCPNEFEVVENFCFSCHNIYCICCYWCGNYPCTCFRGCSSCGQYPPYCYCGRCPNCLDLMCNGNCQSKDACPKCGTYVCNGNCGCPRCGLSSCNNTCSACPYKVCSGTYCSCCKTCKGVCKCTFRICHQSPCSCCKVCRGNCLCPNKKCHKEPCECPCVDFLNGKANPLYNMRLRPPSDYNIKGGTFGSAVRTDKFGNQKGHQGIDLDAPVGTPIHSMYDGVVSENPISEQPNRIGTSKDYPNGYKGDRDGAGNRISISSMINGERIIVSFWHLQEGNAIGINPRTGKPYKKGDQVEAGEIVGYSGISGNSNVYNKPHLHIGIKNSQGHWTDPKSYLNGSISTDRVEIYTPCD